MGIVKESGQQCRTSIAAGIAARIRYELAARIVVPLALLAAVAALSACASRTSPSSSTVTVAAPGATRRVAAMGVARPAQAPATPQTPEPSPEPSIDYASLEAARDAVERLLLNAVDLADTAVAMRRDTVTFQYWYAHAEAHGWAFHIEVRDTSACPIDGIEKALTTAGWAPRFDYQADGPDGGEMGYFTARFLCVVQGQWDGGDDIDTTYVPRPGCSVTVTLVPRSADDVLR
jgi:hypothetical protein